MDDSNSSNQINTSDLLALANEICNVLNINKEIESEKELFSDEVYIRIISNLILEEIKPGNTPEKKVENINLLLSKLSKLIGADLSEINAEKIIIEKDKESVKHFTVDEYNRFMNCNHQEITYEFSDNDSPIIVFIGEDVPFSFFLPSKIASEESYSDIGQ